MVTQADFHRHFELAGHHGFMEDVKVQVIDRIFGESRVREGFWQGRSQWGGGWGAERPPADHLSENFALLSEFLCSK